MDGRNPMQKAAARICSAFSLLTSGHKRGQPAGAGASPGAGAAGGGAASIDCVDLLGDDDDGAKPPEPKRPRGVLVRDSPKFEGGQMMDRLPPSLFSTPPAARPASAAPLAAAPATLTARIFYGAAAAPPGPLRGYASSRLALPRAAAPPAAPRARTRGQLGTSSDMPLEISDDEDEAPALRRSADPLAALAPAASPPDDDTEVVVESERAWIGLRPATKCKLTFKHTKVELWASFDDGTELYYPELICDGFITKLRSGFRKTAQEQWPPNWCAVLALEASFHPDAECAAYFDPWSADPRKRSLACLFLDNDEWCFSQRQIIAMPKWKGIWAKMNLEEHDDLMVGRHHRQQSTAKKSARVRARARRQAPAVLATPLVYPPGDADAVTLTNSDLERLEPGEFLNDNLVDFCLRRLQEELASQPSSKASQRFHFFNCFFFKKLMLEDETRPASSRKGRADEAHERVRKWTSRVDLFQKDFIIIPVNQSLHWTLAIVCYPGEAERAARVGTGAAGDALEIDAEEPSSPSPVIIQLNSMRGTHGNVEGVLREYLAREWAAKRSKTLDEGLALFSSGGPTQFRQGNVPQQDNFCDCGLFLIEFARRFCLAAPSPHLSLQHADGWPYMLTPDWFTPEDAGDSKRDAIRAEVLHLASPGAAATPAAAGPSSAAAAGAGATAASSPPAGLVLDFDAAADGVADEPASQAPSPGQSPQAAARVCGSAPAATLSEEADDDVPVALLQPADADDAAPSPALCDAQSAAPLQPQPSVTLLPSPSPPTEPFESELDDW